MRYGIPLLAALAFGVSVGHEFVWDDLSMFSRPWFEPPVTRPLTELTLWLNAALSPHPSGFHLVNLLLHLINVWLLREVLSLVIPKRAADYAALIFAVHPLQTEAVNYVWARANLLMTTLCLLAIRERLRDRGWRAVAWFALALCAKQECVALPLLLLFERRKYATAMLAASVATGSYILWAANSTPGSQAGAQAKYSVAEYASAQGEVILRYLSLIVIPTGFTVDPALSGGVLLAGAIGWRKLGLWYAAGLILLLPSSSVFPANDLAADRRMYLPMAAFAACVGLAVERVRPRWIIAAGMLLAVLSLRESLVWQSEYTLWTNALTRNPSSVRARLHLARASSDPNEAIPLLERAKELAPSDPTVASALGRAHLRWSSPAQALSEFGRALALSPTSAEAVSNRGVALLAMQQTDAARADFERALRIDPCLFEARLNLHRMRVAPPAMPTHCRWVEWQRRELALQLLR